MARRPVTVAAGAAALVALAGLSHGVTHLRVPVPLADWQFAYVLLADYLGPLSAVVLAFRGRTRAAGGLLAASAAAALGFGLLHHFLLANPDNVAAVPAGPWRLPFRASAAGVAAAEAVALLAGAWLWQAGESRRAG